MEPSNSVTPLSFPRQSFPLTLGVYASFIVVAVMSVRVTTCCVVLFLETITDHDRPGSVMHWYHFLTK